MSAGPVWLVATMAASSVLLAGCGEKSQTLDRSVRKSDTAAWSTSAQAVPAFYAPGWQASGDKAAWEAQINTRTLHGQNDYAAR